jgi:arylsulfatase A-like enzyme
MVGKWHCGDQPDFLPTRHGFERYFGLPYSNDMGRQAGWPTREDGEQPGFPPLPLLRDDEVVEQQPDQVSLTGRYLDEVVSFMGEHRDQPFFVYLAHMYVHLPIYVQDRFAAASRNGRYGAAVASIDWATGVVLDELARLGLDEQTLVVFTSDNGALERDDGGSNLPLRGHKTTTWEGGLRVPGIARWPGRIEAGRTCSEVVSSIDLHPTFAALAGATLPPDRAIDGQDLSGLLLGGEASPRDAFAYYWMDDLCAVRAGRWKLHVARRGEPVTELYDLEADPAEAVDVAGANPDVVADLSLVADEHRWDLGDARLGVVGSGTRPIGRVDRGRPLTAYDPAHPYFAAEYDLPDRG